MRWMVAVAVLAMAVGCKNQQQEGSKTPAQQTSTASAAALPPGAPAQVPSAGGLTGKVLERMDASSYTYLRLETQNGEVWAAVPTNPVTVGTTVSISNPMAMQNFESKSLKRKFDVIMFGSSADVPGAAVAATADVASPGAAAPAAVPAPMGSPTATPPATLDVKTEKAAGKEGRTISEVYTQKAALKDKQVAIRGKVVKFTANVLGKNWLHLRDGSGADTSKDNDITVTTTDTAAVGDTVTVKGVVRLDRDLGSGYSYAVVVEEASISK